MRRPMPGRRAFIQGGLAAAALARIDAAGRPMPSGDPAAAIPAAPGSGMVKVVAPAQHHPTNRTLAQFQNYWGESHGPLFSNTKNLRRYVQHITLTEAYGVDPAPTFD